jgi:hypothetical protein
MIDLAGVICRRIAEQFGGPRMRGLMAGDGDQKDRIPTEAEHEEVWGDVSHGGKARMTKSE